MVPVTANVTGTICTEGVAMSTGIKQAIELYNQAALAKQQGRGYLAEMYYLKSWALFEQAGDIYYVNAASALNALAGVRRECGNHKGAFRSAQKSVQIIEAHPDAFTSAEAEVIHMQAWKLVKDLLLFQEPRQQFSPAF